MAEVPLSIRCFGCKAPLVGEPLESILGKWRERKAALTDDERARIHAHYDALIRAHWRRMMGPEDRKLHRLPMPVPGYEAVPAEVPLADLIDQCTDRGFAGRGCTDGTSYAGAVVQDVGSVALALASRGRRWVVLDRCFQGAVDKAVDVAMGYALTALCGSPALSFGTFALDPLPDPERARLDFHLLLAQGAVVLPNLPRLREQLLSEGPLAEAAQAAASLVASKMGIGRSRASAYRVNHLSQDTRAALNLWRR